MAVVKKFKDKNGNLHDFGATWDNVKPADGVPKDDLAEDVQNGLVTESERDAWNAKGTSDTYSKYVYFDAEVYALKISIPWRTGTYQSNVLIQGTQNGYPFLGILGWSKSNYAKIIGVYYRSLGSNNDANGNYYPVVYYSANANADQAIYLKFTGTSDYRIRATFACDGTSSITLGKAALSEATACTKVTGGQLKYSTQLIANSDGSLGKGNSSTPVYIDQYGSFVSCSSVNAERATNDKDGTPITNYIYSIAHSSGNGASDSDVDKFVVKTGNGTKFTYPVSWAQASRQALAAQAANKLSVSAGSASVPVFFSNGVPVACNVAGILSQTNEFIEPKANSSIGNPSQSISTSYTVHFFDGSKWSNCGNLKASNVHGIVAVATCKVNSGTPTSAESSAAIVVNNFRCYRTGNVGVVNGSFYPNCTDWYIGQSDYGWKKPSSMIAVSINGLTGIGASANGSGICVDAAGWPMYVSISGGTIRFRCNNGYFSNYAVGAVQEFSIPVVFG